MGQDSSPRKSINRGGLLLTALLDSWYPGMHTKLLLYIGNQKIQCVRYAINAADEPRLVHGPDAIGCSRRILQTNRATALPEPQGESVLSTSAGKPKCLGADLVKLAVASSTLGALLGYGPHVTSHLPPSAAAWVLRDARTTGRRFGAKGELLSPLRRSSNEYISFSTISGDLGPLHEQRRGLDNRSEYLR